MELDFLLQKVCFKMDTILLSEVEIKKRIFQLLNKLWTVTTTKEIQSRALN